MKVLEAGLMGRMFGGKESRANARRAGPCDLKPHPETSSIYNQNYKRGGRSQGPAPSTLLHAPCRRDQARGATGSGARPNSWRATCLATCLACCPRPRAAPHQRRRIPKHGTRPYLEHAPIRARPAPALYLPLFSAASFASASWSISVATRLKTRTTSSGSATRCFMEE